METIQNIDNSILYWINCHHSPTLDFIMWWLSDTWIWIPLYLTVFYVLYIKTGKNVLLFVLLIAFLILISDQLASTVFKNYFLRLRPSHNPLIQTHLRYLNDYRGGQYGFISSHAINTFSFVFFLLFTMGKQIKGLLLLLFLWAMAVAYSRIYLGVHFPTDILVPFLLSIPLAWSMSKLYFYVLKKKETKNRNLNRI